MASASALTAAVGMAQHSMDTDIESQQAIEHFNALQELSQQITSDALRRKADLFSEEATHERKLSSALRRQAIEIARRECLRDTWVAHSGNIQASLFIATVLIGFGYEILSGAIISQEWLKNQRGAVSIFFVLTLASIGMGLVALSLLLVRYHRLAQFDFETPWKIYPCGHNHVEMVSFIECRCRWLEKWANYGLIMSACSGLLALMFYSIDKFQNLPVMENAVNGRKNFLAATTSSSNSSFAKKYERVILPDPIRDYAAPVVFCVIVGATIVTIFILEFAYLSSDTLKRRPDDDIDGVHQEENPKNNKNDEDNKDEQKENEKEEPSSPTGINEISTKEKEERDREQQERIEKKFGLENMKNPIDSSSSLSHHHQFVLHSPNSPFSKRKTEEFGHLPEEMSPEERDDTNISPAGLNRDDNNNHGFFDDDDHSPDGDFLRVENNEGRYRYYSSTREKKTNENDDENTHEQQQQQNGGGGIRAMLPKRNAGHGSKSKLFPDDF